METECLRDPSQSLAADRVLPTFEPRRCRIAGADSVSQLFLGKSAAGAEQDDLGSDIGPERETLTLSLVFGISGASIRGIAGWRADGVGWCRGHSHFFEPPNVGRAYQK